MLFCRASTVNKYASNHGNALQEDPLYLLIFWMHLDCMCIQILTELICIGQTIYIIIKCSILEFPFCLRCFDIFKALIALGGTLKSRLCLLFRVVNIMPDWNNPERWFRGVRGCCVFGTRFYGFSTSWSAQKSSSSQSSSSSSSSSPSSPSGGASSSASKPQ